LFRKKQKEKPSCEAAGQGDAGRIPNWKSKNKNRLHSTGKEILPCGLFCAKERLQSEKAKRVL